MTSKFSPLSRAAALSAVLALAALPALAQSAPSVPAPAAAPSASAPGGSKLDAHMKPATSAAKHKAKVASAKNKKHHQTAAHNGAMKTDTAKKASTGVKPEVVKP